MSEQTKVTVSFTCDADVAIHMIAFYGMLVADTLGPGGFSSEAFWAAFPEALVFLTEQAQQVYEEGRPHRLSDIEQKVLEHFLETPTAMR